MNYVTSIFDLTHHAHRFGLDCILHMHSESLITRGRNKMVIRFLEDESLTHLFWIDSDIAFRPQSVCRLLLADRDVCAAVYPMKSFNWPAGGLPQGMTREEFELRFGEFPYNPIDHGKAASKFVDSDGFVEVAEAPTGFMCIKRQVLYDMMKRYPKLNYVPDGPRTIRRRICIGCSSTAWSIPIPAVSVGGLRLLPALARHRRQGLCRRRHPPPASRPDRLSRQSFREPARPGAMVRRSGRTGHARGGNDHAEDEGKSRSHRRTPSFRTAGTVAPKRVNTATRNDRPSACRSSCGRPSSPISSDGANRQRRLNRRYLAHDRLPTALMVLRPGVQATRRARSFARATLRPADASRSRRIAAPGPSRASPVRPSSWRRASAGTP